MSKKNKSLGKHNKLKKNYNFLSPDLLYLLGTIFIVFLVYSFSLFRPWQPFDERLFYNEELFPIPSTFKEIPEIISTFVLNYHIQSMNTFFSNYTTLRSNPIASVLIVIISFFFKKNALLYHSLQLLIHLTNTILIWLILSKISKTLTSHHLLFTSSFTLLWALHSANTEAVLLVTNWTSLLTYTFCLSFLLFEITKIANNNFETSKIYTAFISILFCFVMFLTEYGYTLPLILFFIAFALVYKQSNEIKKVTSIAFKISLPYFIGLFLFILFSILNPQSPLINLVNNTHLSNKLLKALPFYIFLERNLWLTPQIFIHFLKLLFFPKTLSTYQSNLIHLSSTLFEPYSIFCTLLYLFFLLLPIILFIFFKKNNYAFICLLVYALYFSLFPFLHIITPTYCLSADRYCYFPLFIFLLIPFQILILTNQKHTKAIAVSLSCILLLVTIRTLIRIQEWNNPISLYKSAINIEKNPLYKGQKLIVFGDYIGAQGNQFLMEESLQESLRLLNKALKQLKTNRKKFSSQPITLKLYGLDNNSLIQKAAYAIATIKNDNYQEPPKDILAFFEPYIKTKLDSASISQLALYSKILLRDKQTEKAKEVLEYGYKKFPYAIEITNKLVDLYLLEEKDTEKSFKLLQHSYKYFPNNSEVIYKLSKYYEQKNDFINQARFSYLLGLRDHSAEGYQNAIQIYLNLNQQPLAKQALKKLIRLRPNDPFTLLLMSRYLDLTGQRKKILGILSNAYTISKALGEKQDAKVTKSILASLINVNSNLGDFVSAKKYLSEFENIKNPTLEDKIQIENAKKRIKEIES